MALPLWLQIHGSYHLQTAEPHPLYGMLTVQRNTNSPAVIMYWRKKIKMLMTVWEEEQRVLCIIILFLLILCLISEGHLLILLTRVLQLLIYFTGTILCMICPINTVLMRCPEIFNVTI